jgi:cellulose synthase/poly-beta-1,6-N-acetylglucosamine synthase-like glycosyltransferase
MIADYLMILLLVPYLGLMWFFARGFMRQTLFSKALNGSETLPGISVVVAARNEASAITKLLTALQQQKTPPQAMEVIVVDDYSDDGTAALAETFHMSCAFRVIRAAEAGFIPGKKGALNGGIRVATHEVVVVTDADAKPAENWTGVIRGVFSDPACVFAAGLVKYRGGTGFVHALESIDFYGLVVSGAGAAGMGYPFMCNAANMAFRKDAYLQIQGMANHTHRSSGDDVFLLHRMVARFGNERIRWYVFPESVAETNPTGSFKRYFAQRVRWASKGSSYRNPTAIATAIIVLLSNILLVSSFVILLMGRCSPWLPWAMFLMKMVADFPLILMITRRYHQQNLLRWFIPITLIHPLIMMGAGIASFFWKPEWKGRRIR